MSLPFLQQYTGLGNSLQTAQGGAAGVGGWVELARTTLGGTSDTITVSSLANKRYYMLLTDNRPSGNLNVGHRAGNSSIDTGSNYAKRPSINGATDLTHTSQNNFIETDGLNHTDNMFSVNYLTNLASKEKLGLGHCVRQNTAGATNAPNRTEYVGKWTNTSNVIDTLQTINFGSGDLASGSELVVLGWDPADIHTTNFWEELASVEGDGTSTTISSGTITAKKYLWVQAFTNASTQNTGFQFNNDTAGNYSIRRSSSGAADATDTSIAYVEASDTSKAFTNMFIVNNSANEKLCIGHTVHNATAGAGTAPTRNEVVGKWANTSAQITEIDYMQQTTSVNFPSGSILKVWGSD